MQGKKSCSSLYCYGLSVFLHICFLGVLGIIFVAGSSQAQNGDVMEVEMVEIASPPPGSGQSNLPADSGGNVSTNTPDQPNQPTFTPKSTTSKLFAKTENTSSEAPGPKTSGESLNASSQGEGAPTATSAGGGNGGSSGASSGGGSSSSGSGGSSSGGGGNGNGAAQVDWRGRFVARVEGNKTYPFQARKQGVTGVVRVTVVISSDGGLVQNSIAASSGDSRLDQAAQNAVRASTPFPHEAGGNLAMTIPIRFNLN